MLCRNESTSGPQIAEATNWAAHSRRGFLAALRKKGITGQILERVRRVGFSNARSKGSDIVSIGAERQQRATSGTK